MWNTCICAAFQQCFVILWLISPSVLAIVTLLIVVKLCQCLLQWELTVSVSYAFSLDAFFCPNVWKAKRREGQVSPPFTLSSHWVCLSVWVSLFFWTVHRQLLQWLLLFQYPLCLFTQCERETVKKCPISTSSCTSVWLCEYNKLKIPGEQKKGKEKESDNCRSTWPL